LANRKTGRKNRQHEIIRIRQDVNGSREGINGYE
jgi:hypothetical protein